MTNKPFPPPPLYSPETDRLYGLRGEEFNRAYKAAFVELSDRMREEFDRLIEKYGKFTPLCLGLIARKFRLTIKATDDFLASIEDCPYRSGTWEWIKNRGIRATDILEEADRVGKVSRPRSN